MSDYTDLDNIIDTLKKIKDELEGKPKHILEDVPIIWSPISEKLSDIFAKHSVGMDLFVEIRNAIESFPGSTIEVFESDIRLLQETIPQLIKILEDSSKDL